MSVYNTTNWQKKDFDSRGLPNFWLARQPGPHWELHHLIPKAMVNNPLLAKLGQAGLFRMADQNVNGKWLSNDLDVSRATGLARHNGSHPDYDKFVTRILDDIERKYGTDTPDGLRKSAAAVAGLQAFLDERLSYNEEASRRTGQSDLKHAAFALNNSDPRLSAEDRLKAFNDWDLNDIERGVSKSGVKSSAFADAQTKWLAVVDDPAKKAAFDLQRQDFAKALAKTVFEIDDKKQAAVETGNKLIGKLNKLTSNPVDLTVIAAKVFVELYKNGAGAAWNELVKEGSTKAVGLLISSGIMGIAIAFPAAAPVIAVGGTALGLVGLWGDLKEIYDKIYTGKAIGQTPPEKVEYGSDINKPDEDPSKGDVLFAFGLKEQLGSNSGDIIVASETDLVRSGDGNDIVSASGVKTILAGAGDDSILVDVSIENSIRPGVNMIDGGSGFDVVNFGDESSDSRGLDIRATVADKSILLDLTPRGIGTGRQDQLNNVELLVLSDNADLLRVDEAMLKNPFVIDFGDHEEAEVGGLTDLYGDRLDASLAAKGVVINLRDTDNQFAASLAGALPTRLGYDGKGLPEGTFSAIKFLVTASAELFFPTNLSGYGGRDRLNLRDAESAVGTNQSDLIIGADAVYALKTPESDPNLDSSWDVDKNFAGYDLIGNGGNDTILIYSGHRDQVTYHLIDGGAGNDVIVVKDFGDQFTIDARTGEQKRSEIRGGDGNDVIFSLGGGTGGDVIGGAGEDFLFNTAYKGRIWGDSRDGTGSRSRDVFWWSAGSFIMDAGPEDLLQLYGLPLTGGTNIYLGMVATF
ncbi:MAG: AHH domain-containing protein, partial [Methylocystis sp.]|nr:AHH domain-containing protein [Methylocystis sp.]